MYQGKNLFGSSNYSNINTFIKCMKIQSTPLNWDKLPETNVSRLSGVYCKSMQEIMKSIRCKVETKIIYIIKTRLVLVCPGLFYSRGS